MSERARSEAPHAPGKRELNAIRNRNAILAAAREVFCELGYGAATVRDIIRRTDLATGTFYNYFPDKQAVLHVLIEDFRRELRRRVHEARRAAGTLEEMLQSAFRACFELFVEDEVVLALMIRNAGEIHELTSIAALEPATAELAADLRSKVKEGVVPSIDVDRFAGAMTAVASDLAFRTVRTPFDVDLATRFSVELFLGGIERMSREG